MDQTESRMLQLRSEDLANAARLRSEDLAETEDLRQRILKLEASKYQMIGISSGLAFLIPVIVMAMGPFLHFGS